MSKEYVEKTKTLQVALFLNLYIRTQLKIVVTI